jgi:hypothetical protein
MRRIIIAIATTAALLLGLVPATAQGIDAPARVQIAKQGELSDGGNTVTLRVAARCDSGLEVLEAFVTISQDSFVQVGIPLSCTGRRQVFTLRATVLEGSPPFQPGFAQASALVLVLDPVTGQTFQAQDSVQVRLR